MNFSRRPSSRHHDTQVIPVFLDHNGDRVSACLLHCDGLLLPTESVRTWQQHSRRRHELAWALLPASALLVMGWPLSAAALLAATGLMWWFLPPLHELRLSLRHGDEVMLLRTSDGPRVAAFAGALARAAAYRQKEQRAGRPSGLFADAPPLPRFVSHEPAWRDTTVDEVHDSTPGNFDTAPRARPVTQLDIDFSG